MDFGYMAADGLKQQLLQYNNTPFLISFQAPNPKCKKFLRKW